MIASFPQCVAHSSLHVPARKEYLYGEEDTSWIKKKFAPALSSTKKKLDLGEVSGTKQKYAAILEAASLVLRDHPDFHLYVTGHSLGGALATLFAFEAAAAPDTVIPKPVTCVTTGAPKVGNLDFLRCFEVSSMRTRLVLWTLKRSLTSLFESVAALYQKLEAEKKLRCLRISNYRDVVTLSPPNGAFIPCFACFCQSKRFRHVGIRMKLFPDGHFLIAHPPRFYTCFGIMICDLLKTIRHIFYLFIICPLVCLCKNRYTYTVYRQEHTQLAYSNRFKACKDDLEQLSLDQLYKERFARAKWRLPVLHTSREFRRLIKKKD